MNLADKIVENSDVVIDGKAYKVLGKALYNTQDVPETTYYKILFEDHFVLVIVPSEEITYFGKNMGLVKEFETCPFESCPRTVKYLGKMYTQKTHDHQVLLELLFGSQHEVEGNVEFWDYETIENDIISLAIDKCTSKRADVVGRYISLDEIEVFNGK